MIASTCACGGIIRDKVCSRCGPKQTRKHSKTTKQRGYGSDWQRFRARHLAENPLCIDCEKAGKVTPANELHHIRKIKDRPELRLEASNVMALCKDCHDARTAKGE